jgi:hypothetical protein
MLRPSFKQTILAAKILEGREVEAGATWVMHIGLNNKLTIFATQPDGSELISTCFGYTDEEE